MAGDVGEEPVDPLLALAQVFGPLDGWHTANCHSTHLVLAPTAMLQKDLWVVGSVPLSSLHPALGTGPSPQF